jgi:hypothetical protein
MLDGQVAQFRAARPPAQLVIIHDSVKQLERTWSQDVDFDEATVETVCTHPLAMFSGSHSFIGCPQISP